MIGGQNDTISHSSTHRPAAGDALCSQQRAVQEAFPEEGTSGWTSDFAKAYKQIPGFPPQIWLTIIALWSPVHACITFWKPYTQLFGGRSSPQNFSRFPAWFCHILARATAIPTQHCVDDVLGMERTSCCLSGWRTWRKLADVTGWDVPHAESPLPSRDYLAVGYRMLHEGSPAIMA